jgi:signal transduction histidine kinase
VLTIGIVLTVVAGIAETGMAVTDARFMAPLIFAAYLVEAMRITFSSNRSVAESLAESRQAQASQRALIAEQLDRLAAAQRLAEVGSETARLSHDIRNPLAAADVTLELVQELADDISQDRKDEIVELVGLTRDALGTGLALVNRITERARLPE